MHTRLYYIQVAWLPSSHAVKSFQELHGHTSYSEGKHIVVKLTNKRALDIHM